MSTLQPVFASASSKNISLDPKEQKFVDLLDEFAGGLEPPVECRIAGGWVRDKLLSLKSHDLDIALSIPSGYTFALEFVNHLKAKGGVEVGSVGKVAANPEQSKHLETGTTKILGLECDFVGLRSETYTDSRIPDQVTLGTPLEDALRRDLTINSLFYNVHTKTLEDYTGQGLSDLEKRIARTPLPPRQTFFDDPLRAIRCVRFASRFGLEIEEGVGDAIRDEEVQIALQTKVSKERIGIELFKMLAPSKNPLKALYLIDQLNLYNSIFTTGPSHALPPETKIIGSEALKAGEVLKEVLQRGLGVRKTNASQGEEIGEDRYGPEEEDEILWGAAACSPFRGLEVELKPGKVVPAVSLVLSDGLKMSTEINRSITGLLLSPQILNPQNTSRSEIGISLQNPSVKPWERSVIWAATADILEGWKGSWDEGCLEKLEVWRRFVRRIRERGLEDDIYKKPLVDGKQLAKILGIKPSPVFTVIIKAINTWQLDHPGSSPEECEAWVKEMWNGEGRVEWERAVPANQSKAAAGEKRKR